MGNIMNWDSTIWSKKELEQKAAEKPLECLEQSKGRKDLELSPKVEKNWKSQSGKSSV